MADHSNYESPYKSLAPYDSRNNKVGSMRMKNRTYSQGGSVMHNRSISQMSEQHDKSNTSIISGKGLDESFMNSIRKKDDFGIEGYHAPNNDAYLEKVKTMKWIKQDSKNGFLDYVVKMKKDVPACNTYKGCSDWKKELDSALYGGSPMKGKFLKGKRRTEIDMIMENNKKETRPGPGTYDPKGAKPRAGSVKSTVEKGQFIDHYRAVGQDTPGAIYKMNYDRVMPKVHTTKIFPMTQKEKEKYKKVKSELPDAGTYNIEGPSLKVKERIRITQFSKKPKNSFIDEEKKNKSFLPGVGHYKEVDKGYKRISSLPVSLKSKRH